MTTELWIQWTPQTDNVGRLRWCVLEQQKSSPKQKNGSNTSAFYQGDTEDLSAFVQEHNLQGDCRAVLLLNGDEVVTRYQPFAASERKHLDEMLPYTLESSLAVDLAKVHVAYTIADEDLYQSTAVVSYTDRAGLEQRITKLENMGLDVEAVYALPALLAATKEQWLVFAESAELCHLHAPGMLCVSASDELIGSYLQQLLASSEVARPVSIGLAGEVSETLKAAITAAGVQCTVVQQPWQQLVMAQKNAVNLRQGQMAPPLRIGHYWKACRVPVLVASLAFATALCVNVVATVVDQQRWQHVEQQINERYRAVVPEGVLIDPVQQLSAQITRLGPSTQGAGLVTMMEGVARIWQAHPGVTMHTLNYQHPRGGEPELQISISAATTADILGLGEQLSAEGWHAQTQNISRSGQVQLASLVIKAETL